MLPTFIFTRYLYEKEEVKLALMNSLLKKNLEESLFWAYELYYSGFSEELFNWFLHLYFDFYAILNPSFGSFLMIKYKLYFIEKKEKLEDKCISMIIHDFIIRPFNFDLFTLRNQEKKLETKNLKDLLNYKCYSSIANYVYQLKIEEIEYNIKIIILYFSALNISISKKKYSDFIVNKDILIDLKIILLFIILHHFAILEKIKLGKNIYVVITNEEVETYQTKEIIPAYKTLRQVTNYPISYSFLPSFLSLNHVKKDIVNAYRENWLYYASFSPIWKERIEEYDGIRKELEKKITFLNEDLEEAFFEKYNFEPDEQSLNIQQRCIGEMDLMDFSSWKLIYSDYVSPSLIK
jgi:hypothetical protein